MTKMRTSSSNRIASDRGVDTKSAGSDPKNGGRARVETDEKARKARQQALEFTLGQIEKKCGSGAIMYLGSDHKADVSVISSGSMSLDIALGVGGIPRGRITEIYGPESSGKTTLTLHMVANAQRGANRLAGACVALERREPKATAKSSQASAGRWSASAWALSR